MRLPSLCLVLLIGVFILPSCGGAGPPTTSRIRYGCEVAVKMRLDDPSSAEFSNESETEIVEVTAGTIYRVRGFVFGQYSLRAKIRGRYSYSCTVSTYTSGNDRTYVVESVSM